MITVLTELERKIVINVATIYIVTVQTDITIFTVMDKDIVIVTISILVSL